MQISFGLRAREWTEKKIAWCLTMSEGRGLTERNGTEPTARAFAVGDVTGAVRQCARVCA